MIKVGSNQKMKVSRKTSIGLYLEPLDEPDHEGILLPKKYVSPDMSEGLLIDVFVYRDSDDRLIATTLVPLIHTGEIGILRVVSDTTIGAFLDWGLEKDLLLPKSEQLYPLKPGDRILVYAAVDKTNRIYASMQIQKFLELSGPFKKDDTVNCVVYKIVREIGAFVAIENKYMALIPRKELFKELFPGDRLEARVVDIKPDGKIDLSLRNKAYKERISDSKKIYDRLVSHGGALQINDKSSPEKVKAMFEMSKASFKRALGKLLSEKKIVFIDQGIRLTEDHNKGPSEK
jgi:uncharacterized protein